MSKDTKTTSGENMQQMSTDKKLKKLIIKSYPFLNNGESFEDDCDVIYDHYLASREGFLKTEEWSPEHELMFAYVLTQSDNFKKIFQWHLENNMATSLGVYIKEKDIPKNKIEELLD